MDAGKVVELIEAVGHSYESLLASGKIPSHSLDELYPGCDRLDLEVENGIELTFWAETKVLESFFITLMKTMPSTVKYEGELPRPYTSAMNQSDVHRIFGDPMESRGPIKMPEPMGQTGGWESYPLDPTIHPGKKVVFQYTAAMEVKTLVFTLIDKGHD
ncbi:DUF6392 family protein [Pseudomonas silesiensis]|uniref:DUF6392 family protein n=1 Tax=Pseudomonas silesiensis TaxID=1853130 RepID=UPI0030D54163